MYLLDTNTIIYFFKGLGNAAEILLSKSPKDIAIPAIVLYELEVGIAKSSNPKKRKKQLESLVSPIAVLPFTAKEAEISAKIRAELENERYHTPGQALDPEPLQRFYSAPRGGVCFLAFSALTRKWNQLVGSASLVHLRIRNWPLAASASEKRTPA